MILAYPKFDRTELYNRIKRKYECTHVRHEVRKKTIKGGRLMICAQCIKCGDAIGSAIKQEKFTTDQIAALPEWDSEKRAKHWAKFEEEFKKAEEAAKTTALTQFRIEYDAYRATPEWKRKCELVKLRAQGICEGCRVNKATETHHLTYEHCREEFLFELVAICEPCHRRFHGTETPAHPPQIVDQKEHSDYPEYDDYSDAEYDKEAPADDDKNLPF